MMDILDQLLSSRVRAKILEVLFLSPGLRINAYQLTQSTNQNYNAVWKELMRLESLGILRSVRNGKTKEYFVNPDCPIERELSLLVLKTRGVGAMLREDLQNNGSVQIAFIFGSYANGTADDKSDIDLFLIGEVDSLFAANLCVQLESKIKRPVNYVLFTDNEWKNKKENGDPFILNIINSSKIFIKGDENGL